MRLAFHPLFIRHPRARLEPTLGNFGLLGPFLAVFYVACLINRWSALLYRLSAYKLKDRRKRRRFTNNPSICRPAFIQAPPFARNSLT